MNKKLSILISSLVLVALPIATLAFDAGPTPGSNASLNVNELVGKILDFIWPLFIGFAVIMFLVAGFLFLTAQGDASKVAAARQAVLWGVVGVVVGVLAFSIPFIIRNQIT